MPHSKSVERAKKFFKLLSDGAAKYEGKAIVTIHREANMVRQKWIAEDQLNWAYDIWVVNEEKGNLPESNLVDIDRLAVLSESELAMYLLANLGDICNHQV